MNVKPEMTRVAEGGTQNNSNAQIHGVGLPVAIAALAVATLSVGLWVATMVFAPQIVDAKIKAGGAEAYALAELARKEASAAKDMVDLDRQKAKAREEMKNERR